MTLRLVVNKLQIISNSFSHKQCEGSIYYANMYSTKIVDYKEVEDGGIR